MENGEIEIEKENVLEIEEEEENIPLIMPSIRTQPGPRDTGLHQDIILCGLPLSGCSSLSKKLSKKLKLIIRNLDEILHEIVVTDSEYGVLARKYLKLSSENEKIEHSLKIEKLFFASEESKKNQIENNKKDKKKPKDVKENEITLTPETILYEKMMKNDNFNAENLSKLIKHRLEWSDVGAGIIIDGLFCSYLEEKTCIKALKSKFATTLLLFCFYYYHYTYYDNTSGSMYMPYLLAAHSFLFIHFF